MRLLETVCSSRKHRTPGRHAFGKERTTVDDHRHRVLIVDDERTIADTLTLVFSASGCESRAAYSAKQALGVFAEWLPHLAIIDVVLPVMNGIDLAILLTGQCPSCRLLLFSGQWITTDLLAEAAKKDTSSTLSPSRYIRSCCWKPP
jgi:CheY-like chemotaxis protein